MSLEATMNMNDLYDIGVIVIDNKLNLINACDNEEKARVSVIKTIAQEDVNITTKCTVTVNDVSEKHEEKLENNIYKYKTSVPVPRLGMVDDIADEDIAKCGLDSALAMAHLNAQTNHKNLKFGSSKCVKMHVGCKVCCLS